MCPDQKVPGPGDEGNIDLKEKISLPRGNGHQLSDSRLLRAIIDNIPDGISVHDRDFNIMITNPVMMKMFPDSQPLEGKKCYSAYFGLYEPCPNCPCKKTLYTGKFHSAMARMTLKSIGTVWLETYAYPLFDAGQNVTGVITLHHNNTERIQLEHSKSQAELYLDLLSHDINNLNQIVLANLELANAGRADPELKNRIVASIEVLNSMSGLIQNLNKIRKVEQGESQLHNVDISEVLYRVVERYADTPGKTVTIRFQPVRRSMTCANGLVDDLFSNLIQNAIKHSTADHVNIDIIMSIIKKDEKWYNMVTIEDCGPGISDENKQRIFERAFTLSKKTQGKGLGLYLVKTLVDRYNGRVWVEDRVPGDYAKGSKFIVMLPATE